MGKRVLIVSLVLTLMSGLAGFVFALDQWSGEGEVVEISCPMTDNARGPDHAACAKKCLSGGSQMGLLLEDGTIVKLVAGDDEAPYKSLIDLAGKQAKVSGSQGDDVVTVATAAAG